MNLKIQPYKKLQSQDEPGKHDKKHLFYHHQKLYEAGNEIVYLDKVHLVTSEQIHRFQDDLLMQDQFA